MKQLKNDKMETTIKTGDVLKNIKQGYLVIYKNMVNEKEFRTMDDFQLLINDFIKIN